MNSLDKESNDTISISDVDYKYAVVDNEGAILVEGIENWIQGLLIIEDSLEGDFLRVKDSKTNAVFLIKRAQ